MSLGCESFATTGHSSAVAVQNTSFFSRTLEIFDPYARLANSYPRRWFILLTLLGVAWLLATSLTVIGLYGISCHRFDHQLVHAAGYANPSNCAVEWTGEAHFIMIIGAILNVSILLVMLTLFIHEKMLLNTREDPPPDYNTVIKSETPPPNYDEVIIENQHQNVTEANPTGYGSSVPEPPSTLPDAPPPSYYSVIFSSVPSVAEILSTESSVPYAPLHNDMTTYV